MNLFECLWFLENQVDNLVCGTAILASALEDRRQLLPQLFTADSPHKKCLVKLVSGAGCPYFEKNVMG